MCKFSMFVMVTWLLFGTLQGPNAWSQTLQTSKRHTFGVSTFHRYHWFGVKPFPIGCAQDSRRVPLKCCFFICIRPRYNIPEFFTIAPVLIPPLWRFAAEIAEILVFYTGLRCVTSITEQNIVVLLWPGAAQLDYVSYAAANSSDFKQRLKLLKVFAILWKSRDSSKLEVQSSRTPESRRRWTQMDGKAVERQIDRSVLATW